MSNTYDLDLGGEYYDEDDEEFELADAEFDLPARRPLTDQHSPGGERLQKVLARAGVGSRRVCEDLIARGQVSVNGKRATLGMRIDPQRDIVQVDGARIETRDDMIYLAFNKPAGVLSAMSDDRGRYTLSDYIESYVERGIRLFHVGRLDSDTEGLILLTNDGALAHKLAHPSFGVEKTYIAEIIGPVARDVGKRLRAGIELEDGPAKVDSFRLIEQFGNRVMVEVVLHEGRKHIVRRLLEAVGHPVQSLARTKFGPIHLGAQRSGIIRPLNSKEIAELHAAVEK
ncbi:pseudouridine synthase [Blastococcus sp. Marseille-P5729]|uniref:pseudouridine synthase n=1 Tax=Blastococcus sp. Marseille-P5729 TaxID=2086582 RepID=UPI000D0E5D18|nr:pseudouridine synthase [Blastococcus sp. Marseille-P5729]